MIAKFLGDPSPDNWPSVSTMPDYNKINFKTMKPLSVEEIANRWSVSTNFAKFLLKLLRYQQRNTSIELIKDEYFQDMVLLQSITTNIDLISIRGAKLRNEAKQKKII